MENNCYIKQLSAYCLSNVFQFFEGKEILKYSSVSHQFFDTSQIDYLWKALATNECVFIQRRKSETWKKAYFRKVLGVMKNMKANYVDPNTGQASFQYEMAPIRAHSDIICQVDIFNNLVISLDNSGLICLSFINYDDPEEVSINKINEFEGRNVKCFQYDQDSSSLFVIDSMLNVALYKLDVDEDQQECNVDSTLYSRQIDEVMVPDAGEENWLTKSIVKIFGKNVIVAPDYRERQSEGIKGTILLIDRTNGNLTNFISHTNDDMQDLMNVDFESHINPIPIWDYFGTNVHRDSVCYDPRYDRLLVSDFLCNIDVISTATGKFVKKLNIKQHRLGEKGEEMLSNLLNETVFNISLNNSFIYITTNLNIYILKRYDLQVDACFEITNIPVKVRMYSVSRAERESLKANENEQFITKLVYGFSDKNSLSWSSFYHVVSQEEQKDDDGNLVHKDVSSLMLTSEGSMPKKYENLHINYHWRRRIGLPFQNLVQATDNIHSVDINNSLAVCACGDMKVNVFDMDLGKSIYYLPSGSKFVKSYKEHPQKPGVSEIKLSEDKICLVLGNIMRVYSFDVEE